MFNPGKEQIDHCKEQIEKFVNIITNVLTQPNIIGHNPARSFTWKRVEYSRLRHANSS